MNEALPDARPLTRKFLSSLSQFLEIEHRPLGEGDISSRIKQTIAGQAAPPAKGSCDRPHPSIPPKSPASSGTPTSTGR